MELTKQELVVVISAGLVFVLNIFINFLVTGNVIDGIYIILAILSVLECVHNYRKKCKHK